MLFSLSERIEISHDIEKIPVEEADHTPIDVVDSNYGVSNYGVASNYGVPDSENYGISNSNYGVSNYGYATIPNYGVSNYGMTNYGVTPMAGGTDGVSNYGVSNYGVSNYGMTNSDAEANYGNYGGSRRRQRRAL